MIYTYTKTVKKEKSLINSSTVSENLWNSLKCFLNIFLNDQMIWVHSLPYFEVQNILDGMLLST